MQGEQASALAEGHRLLGDIADRLRREDDLNRRAINLVPSENRLSPLASVPLRSDFYNRYFFNARLAEEEWNFRGGQGVGDVEVGVGIPTLARLAGGALVNVRPVSGMSAMFLVLMALGGEPGDAVVSIDPATGGHYATTSVIGRLGRRALTVGQRGGTVDAERLRAVLREHRPALVYLDLQNSLAEIDVAGVVQTVREASPHTRVHADVSHTLGLVLGGAHRNPLDLGADTMGGSTHKTFPGPHKGVLFTRDPDIADRIARTQFETISSHHFAETLSLCLAAAEFELFGASYAAQVIDNARVLGAELLTFGFEVVVGTDDITDCHQVWVDTGPETDPMRFAAGLAEAGVRVNVIPDLPGFDGRPALRLGSAELTFEGARAESMSELVQIFDLVRRGRVDEAGARRIALRENLGEPFFLRHDDPDGHGR
jgi:glycine/serine hydroxymethyltransferase